jgi:hypothetical protein
MCSEEATCLTTCSLDLKTQSTLRSMDINTRLDTIFAITFICRGPRWSHQSSILKMELQNTSQKIQEAARKDIERTFGVLQARWHILTVRCGLREKEDVMRLMQCCIIFHNMIVEEQSPKDEFLNNANLSAQIIPNHTNPRLAHTLVLYIQNNQTLHNEHTHAQLQEDLKIHNWLLRGDEAV